jgi:hypothetical protein
MTPGPLFNYDLQVWIVGPDHLVKPCGHPERMRLHGPCCNAELFKGLTEDQAIALYEQSRNALQGGK